MTSQITPKSYVFKFGKFINMKACDVARLTKVDKYGNDVNVGLQYLEFLVDKCDWFRHKDIITQVIHEAKKNIKEPEEDNKDVVKKKNTSGKKTQENLVKICTDDDEKQTVKF